MKYINDTKCFTNDILFSASKHYNMAHYKTNPNWMNTIKNSLQLQTEKKEPGLSKCWR